MRPARKGPENRVWDKRRERIARASMRPARKGPENQRENDDLRRMLAELQ